MVRWVGRWGGVEVLRWEMVWLSGGEDEGEGGGRPHGGGGLEVQSDNHDKKN